ncbi:MAG: hypothetical protein FWE17_02760 [Alphaproteobacteria bacterium]|nr:hypothetical protein [Alphaproteobacteria bacterium]MCL2758357.1 hypothetical protein [Alphaproteobacteria bacterium]
MKEKIKDLLSFCGEAWRGRMRGKIGLLMVLFALFMMVRMFVGSTSVHGYIRGHINLSRERAQLAVEQERLSAVNTHIALVQSHSPDFIKELAQKRLNVGDPNLRILR